jgi:hypothetical protein
MKDHFDNGYFDNLKNFKIDCISNSISLTMNFYKCNVVFLIFDKNKNAA